MNNQSRSKKILNSIKRGAFGTVMVLLLLAIAGTIYQTAATESDKRNFPAPGNLDAVFIFIAAIVVTIVAGADRLSCTEEKQIEVG